jgi:hypothetical protein
LNQRAAALQARSPATPGHALMVSDGAAVGELAHNVTRSWASLCTCRKPLVLW